MSASTLDKPVLWSYREAAEIFGMTKPNDYKVVAMLARELGIKAKPQAPGNLKGLDRADLSRLARALEKTLPDES